VLKLQCTVRLKKADKDRINRILRRARQRISNGEFSKLAKMKHSLSGEFFALEASSLLSQGKRYEASQLLAAAGIEPLAAGILLLVIEKRREGPQAD